MPERLEDVALSIEGERFRRWEQVEIHLSLDSFDTIAFNAPFEVSNPAFRETFRPFSFRPLTVELDDRPLFTGTLVGVEPQVSDDSKTVAVSGYARPAVLADSTAPIAALPLEFQRMDLRQIATKLAQPFGIEVVIEGDPGPAFERVKIEPDGKVADFLAQLARQRGKVMTNTAEGYLAFIESARTTTPVAIFRQGEPPLSKVSATFGPQSYFSEITGLAPKKTLGRSGKHTVRNPHLTGVLRPLTFTLGDADAADIESATQAKLGRMFGNMVSYVVEVPTWRDKSGSLWRPNTTVALRAEDVMTYHEISLLVRDVFLRQDSESQSASLGLVLHGAFSGEVPEVMPWE